MKTRKLLFVSMLIVLILAACGGGSSGGGDPVGVVKDTMKAMEKLDTDKASEYFCKDKKDQMKNAMGDMSDLAELGISENDLKDIFSIDAGKLEYEEKSSGDDKAVVHISGSMKMSVDADKFKGFLKKAAEAAGEAVSDEELDLVMGMMTAMFSQDIPADGDVNLVKEGSDWKICDDFDFFDTAGLFAP